MQARSRTRFISKIGTSNLSLRMSREKGQKGKKYWNGYLKCKWSSFWIYENFILKKKIKYERIKSKREFKRRKKKYKQQHCSTNLHPPERNSQLLALHPQVLHPQDLQRHDCLLLNLNHKLDSKIQKIWKENHWYVDKKNKNENSTCLLITCWIEL